MFALARRLHPLARQRKLRPLAESSAERERIGAASRTYAEALPKAERAARRAYRCTWCRG